MDKTILGETKGKHSPRLVPCNHQSSHRQLFQYCVSDDAASARTDYRVLVFSFLVLLVQCSTFWINCVLDDISLILYLFTCFSEDSYEIDRLYSSSSIHWIRRTVMLLTCLHEAMYYLLLYSHPFYNNLLINVFFWISFSTLRLEVFFSLLIFFLWNFVAQNSFCVRVLIPRFLEYSRYSLQFAFRWRRSGMVGLEHLNTDGFQFHDNDDSKNLPHKYLIGKHLRQILELLKSKNLIPLDSFSDIQHEAFSFKHLESSINILFNSSHGVLVRENLITLLFRNFERYDTSTIVFDFKSYLLDKNIFQGISFTTYFILKLFLSFLDRVAETATFLLLMYVELRALNKILRRALPASMRESKNNLSSAELSLPELAKPLTFLKLHFFEFLDLSRELYKQSLEMQSILLHYDQLIYFQLMNPTLCTDSNEEARLSNALLETADQLASISTCSSALLSQSSQKAGRSFRELVTQLNSFEKSQIIKEEMVEILKESTTQNVSIVAEPSQVNTASESSSQELQYETSDNELVKNSTPSSSASFSLYCAVTDSESAIKRADVSLVDCGAQLLCEQFKFELLQQIKKKILLANLSVCSREFNGNQYEDKIFDLSNEQALSDIFPIFIAKQAEKVQSYNDRAKERRLSPFPIKDKGIDPNSKSLSLELLNKEFLSSLDKLNTSLLEQKIFE